MDPLRQAPLALVASTITGGEAAVKEARRRYKRSKRDLVSATQIHLQTSRLKVAAALPEAATRVQELLAVQVKVTPEAYDADGAWQEGNYDELVLAGWLTCWHGKQGGQRRAASSPIAKSR